MKNYNDLKNEISRLNEIKQVYELLHESGISYKTAEDFKFFQIESGFSMGETTELRIKSGGKMSTIFYEDETEKYPGGKWKARHGQIIVTFTRKELKEYIKLCSGNDTDEMQKYVVKHISSYDTKNNREVSYIDVNLY